MEIPRKIYLHCETDHLHQCTWDWEPICDECVEYVQTYPLYRLIEKWKGIGSIEQRLAEDLENLITGTQRVRQEKTAVNN